MTDGIHPWPSRRRRRRTEPRRRDEPGRRAHERPDLPPAASGSRPRHARALGPAMLGLSAPPCSGSRPQAASGSQPRPSHWLTLAFEEVTDDMKGAERPRQSLDALSDDDIDWVSHDLATGSPSHFHSAKIMFVYLFSSGYTPY